MVIPFYPVEDMDIYEMDRQQLLSYQAQMLRQLEDLDAREPKCKSGDDFEDWAEEHEELEDFLDEIQELLDTIQEK